MKKRLKYVDWIDGCECMRLVAVASILLLLSLCSSNDDDDGDVMEMMKNRSKCARFIEMMLKTSKNLSKFNQLRNENSVFSNEKLERALRRMASFFFYSARKRK